MKRARTLTCYYSRVPITQLGEDEANGSPLPLAAEQERNQSVTPPSEGQGTDQETNETRISVVATRITQVEPSAQEETIPTRASVHVVELSQPPLEPETLEPEGSNENVGHQEDFDHELNLDDIIADPGLRIPIEEMHPNIRDDAKREYVLLGPCQPRGHKYPKRKICGRNRSFQEKWYTNRTWLEYSVSKDAAFSFYCYLFRPLRVDNFGVESFTKNGFTSWKDGPKLLNDHANSIAHNKARQDYESYKNQRQSVKHKMDKGTKKGQEEYKGRMIIILTVVRFLLLQAHAFRGHDESLKSSNKGNFLDMLEWYKQKDKNAARMLGTAGKNSKMTSPKIQKDLCKACGELTARKIVEDIGNRNFAVLVDEARDASIKEQMAVIVRYVNAKGQVIERFLGIKHVTDTTSASLKEALEAMFARYGLSMSRVRGQGYDGASNMRGEFHGLQRKILDENPYAFFIHCFAHQLQLVVVSVSKSCSSIFDFFNITTLIVNTVNGSCKRRDQLSQKHHEDIVSQLENGKIFSGSGKNQQTNLARAGDTRWGSHHKTLCRLEHMWDAVLEVLENIVEDGVGEKRTTASGLLLQMENFEFAFILHLMIKLLGITNDLSQCLQRKDQNIVRAVSLIGITLEKINDVRQHGWDDLFEEVKEFCLIHHIDIPNMEDTLTIRGCSRGRGGQQVTYYHHFKNEIFNVVYDQLIVELNNRFAERSTKLLRCIACLDPKNSFANFEIDKLVELAEMYEADFCHYDRSNLRTQLGHFLSDVRRDPDFTNCVDLGTLAIKMVESNRHTTFSLVYRLIELALILPVATATVERVFSAMKIVKTESRNKMGDKWLNHRMTCYIERDVFASLENEEILYYFQELKSRLKKLPKLPSSNTSGIADEEMEDVTI